jgi:hypothetical protein
MYHLITYRTREEGIREKAREVSNAEAYVRDDEVCRLVLSGCSTNSSFFMKPDSSLQFSQNLHATSYPEPDEFSPQAPAYLHEFNFNIILLPKPRSSK